MEKEKLFMLLENSEHLPKLPQSASDILAMLKNPIELDIDMLVSLVSNSEQLNALMMKNLNSGYFKLNREVNTIKEAVVFLGMQTVQNLIIFFITQQLFSNVKSTTKNRLFDMPLYWRHVIGTAVASSMLASRTKKGDKYKLFSYGLIHDIGMVFLNTCLPEQLDKVSQIISSGVHQLVAERAILGGVTHAEVGAWLCNKWNIRDDITNIVRFHHSPFLAKSNQEEVKMIYAADVISTEYYEKLLGVNLTNEMSQHILRSVGITSEDRAAVIEALPEEVEKLHSYFTA